MSDDVMIDEFKIEAAELFEEAENSLLNIDKGEDFLTNYNNIFRAFHSLKGAAGMFGLLELQEHMHKLESLFEAQKKIASMNNKQIDYFLNGIDAAKKLLNGEHASFYHIDMADFNEIEQDSAAVVKPTPTKLRPKMERKKGVVFVVPDGNEKSDVLVKILEEHGYAPYEFSTEKEACDALDEMNPDVVFGGISMIKALAEIESDAPMIFISEKMSEANLAEAFQHGAYSFLKSPYEFASVIATCGNAIHQRKMKALVEASVNYILYQFTDLDQYLKAQGKEGVRTALKKDLQNILEQRKVLASFPRLGE